MPAQDFSLPPYLNLMSHISYLVITLVFSVGLIGFLIRKNGIIILMCLELMVNSVNFFIIKIALEKNSYDGVVFFIFILTLAACEVALGLCLLLHLYRKQGTLNVDLFNKLKG